MTTITDEPPAPEPPAEEPPGAVLLDDPVDEPSDPTGGSGRGPSAQLRRGWARFVGMPLEGWVSLAVVASCVAFVFVQLGPHNLLSDTTPAGGDMGAHVWAPAYLRDHLLPSFRLAGWTPDWYAGFPAFQFYMIIPSLAIALLSYVIPYGVAFKLVAVSGVLSLPVAAWAFGRLTRMPFPLPPLLAVGATMFLFDRSFSILGGNLASTLAGEFAFSIALTFAVLYLGVLGRGLETGRYRGWAAVLLALTGLCHLIPLFFALAGTVVWLVLRPGVARLKYLATMLPVGGLLTAFWIVPFYLRSGYMNDMGWEKKTNYVNLLFERQKLDPQLVDAPGIKWVLALAAVGALLGIVFRRRSVVFWLAMAVVAALGFRFVPQARLWNARLLPFYYLSLYLLAAAGVAEIGRTLASLVARDPARPVRAVRVVVAVAALVAGLTVLAMPLHAMPNRIGPFTLGQENVDGTYSWLFLSTKGDSFLDSWTRWNFSGYEGKPAYPEYHDIVQTMAGLGEQQGCGRAMWEHEEQHDRYGTPMALMLLPFWTDGCIGSMEGLYFEASATTPYHFLNQDELSTAPSNAQRDLPYGPGAPTKAEFDEGIQHLQMFGVKYYMAISDRMIDFGRKNPDLTEVATSGPWVVFEVADRELVQGLTNQPAVVTGIGSDAKAWQNTMVDWYMDPLAWDVFLAADGPSEWQRIEPGQTPTVKPEDTVSVSNTSTSTDTIEFDVSQPGVPVLVKASYFPNWKADGADGPYRVSPNLMVVVPTGKHVKLHYGYTGVDVLGYGLSLLGVVGLIWLFRAAPITMPAPRPRRRRSVESDDFDELDVLDPDAGLDADATGEGGPAVPARSGDGRATEPAAFDPAAVILGPVADLGPRPDSGSTALGSPGDGEPRDPAP